jgi:hypothetical protein
MTTFKCKVCGSTDVEIRAWIKPNEDNFCSGSGYFSDIINDPENGYCCDCGENQQLIIITD